MRLVFFLLISLEALFFIVHGQSLDHERQSTSCSARSVFPASSKNGTNVPMLTCTLLNILGSLLDEFDSFIVIHDDSTMARAVIKAYLSYQKMQKVPIITGKMRELQSDPDLIYKFFQSHNERMALVVILFLNRKMTSTFLETASSGGLLGPLVLLTLEGDNSARELLLQVGSVRHIALITPHMSSDGKLKYTSTTFLPYSTPKFQSKEVDLDNLMVSSIFAKEDSLNFKGKNFQLASWIDDFPYLFYNNDKEVDGIGIVMLREIASRVNFTFSLQEIPPDGYWGELINGTWVGMLGQVLRKEKDFIINGFAVVLDRYQAADFTVPYFTDSYSITLKVPPPFPRWLSVVYPFNRWVWAAVILTLLVLAIIYHLLIRNDHDFVYYNKYDVVSTLVWLSRNLLHQSAPKLPSSLGCRAFLACWWIAALVLSTSYMGNLIAFLTVPFQARRIATLEELGNSKIKIHMLDYGNFVPGFLWSSKEPVLHELGKKLTLLPDYDDVIAAFDDGASVLEASAYSQFLFITRKRTKISYAVEEKLFPNYVAWAFQKGFPYKHVFDRYLERMKHSGLVEHWHRSVVDNFRISTGQVSGGEVSGEKTNLQPLTLDNLQGAFIVLGLGTILAISALICELLTAGVK